MRKIVLIGAGSVMFGAGTLKDLLSYKEALAGSGLCLVDTDEEKIRLTLDLARRTNEAENSPFIIEGGTNRLDFIAEADYIIISAAIKGRISGSGTGTSVKSTDYCRHMARTEAQGAFR